MIWGTPWPNGKVQMLRLVVQRCCSLAPLGGRDDRESTLGREKSYSASPYVYYSIRDFAR